MMLPIINKEILTKYDMPGPRYTSYPTAPEWSKEITAIQYTDKLKAFGLNDKSLSLYIHIPFCESLCYFCACNKVIRAQQADVGDEFLEHLITEMRMVAKSIKQRKIIKQLHWGGGTPTYLSINQMQRLMTTIQECFDIDFNGEIAIEVDPRTVKEDKLKILRALGFNRISMGVQDFDPKVQDDINRIQPYNQVKEINDYCRALKFLSVNFDLIYGLPYQTRESFKDTVEKVIGLRPDRIALYSFAYVPWISKPQNKFNLDAVPVHEEKLEIFLQSRNLLMAAGYEAIGMDHFALATDEMAIAYREGRLHRNFMGYTVKPADEYIGLGPSAIGFLENTYVQNVKVLPEYYKIIASGQLAIERGMMLSDDDMMRRWVINQWMCTFGVNKRQFKECFGHDFNKYFEFEAQHIAECLEDDLLSIHEDELQATALGRLFIRNICMGFDAYLRKESGHKRFSRTI